jgi:YHS domain-containing protein
MIGNTMTAARRGWKLCLFCAVIPLFGGVSALGGATEYIVVDRHRGLAISGFDPVAYFTEAQPTLGKGEFEYSWQGAVWRFRNEGNRAAFMADPEVYMPRFGGYDPVAVGRGVGVPGNPQVWLVNGERVYLFYTPAAKAAFAANPEAAIAAADQNWPSVQLTLSPSP